jgi:flagellar biosynthesis/type III secretory pathway M-ring protein FliF/YscJ
MTIVKDTIKPILTIEALSPNAQGVLNIKGTTETGATITINGKPVPVVNGAFNKEIDLSYGANLIVIESKDAAGNVQEIRELVTYSSMPIIGFLPLSVISMIVLLLIGLFIGYVLLGRIRSGKRIEEEEEVTGEVWEEEEEPVEELEAEEEIEKEAETEEEEMGKESEEEKEGIKEEKGTEEVPEKDLEELGREIFGEE